MTQIVLNEKKCLQLIGMFSVLKSSLSLKCTIEKYMVWTDVVTKACMYLLTVFEDTKTSYKIQICINQNRNSNKHLNRN